VEARHALPETVFAGTKAAEKLLRFRSSHPAFLTELDPDSYSDFIIFRSSQLSKEPREHGGPDGDAAMEARMAKKGYFREGSGAPFKPFVVSPVTGKRTGIPLTSFGGLADSMPRRHM